MSAFFDTMVIGEGEEVILRSSTRTSSGGRRRIAPAAAVGRLARIPGVYVPTLYTGSYAADERWRR